MADFFTTTGCAHQIEQIVTNAREKLFLISPFLRVSPILLERLEEAAQRGVRITIVFGKKKLRDEVRINLTRISKFELRYLANLHAKCYASEHGLLITSMNLHEFSEKNNREMGMFLNPQEEAYLSAWRELESIVRASVEAPTPSETEPLRGVQAQVPNFSDEPRQRMSRASVTGYCVRCRVDIPFNADRPLCAACFKTWNVFANAEYPERWCHDCGDEAEISMARPLCRSCFRATYV